MNARKTRIFYMRRILARLAVSALLILGVGSWSPVQAHDCVEIPDPPYCLPDTTH